MAEAERRAVAATIEVRGGGDAGPTRIAGYAALFDTLSEDLGGFREQIAAGTFTATIEEDDVRALFNHSPDMVLGRNKAGTLRLWEDSLGLGFEIDPPNTQAARDLIESIGRGDVTQNSFGFRTLDDEWNRAERLRTLRRVRLIDVSPVTFPAYPDTRVALRSLERVDADAVRRAHAARARRLELLERM